MTAPIVKKMIITKNIVPNWPREIKLNCKHYTWRYEYSDIALTCSSATSYNNEQILDSDCTYHMYLNRKFFSSLELESVVYMGTTHPVN